MDNLQRTVRKYVFDYFLEHSRPPVLEQIMRKFELSRIEAYNVLRELEKEKALALVKGTQRILMAFPFSSIATPFRVAVKGGREYFANCAWDAIAFNVMLDKDMRIDSFCHHCAEEVELGLSNQGTSWMKPDGLRVYIGLPVAKWWEDIVNTCSNNMTFFSSKKHLAEWLSVHPSENGQSLTVEQMIKLSVPLYKSRMDVDYTRLPKEELLGLFNSMGLTGEFWKL